MKIYTITILIFTLQASIIGQTDSLFKMLAKSYEANNYSETIKISDNILSAKESLSEKDLLKIYEMRAVCFYSQFNKDSSRTNFISALNLNDKYEPKIQDVSPKIINFFKNVKVNYLKIVTNNNSSLNKKNKIEKPSSLGNKIHYINTTALSIFAPGAGHLYNGHKTKGYSLLSASTLLLGGSVYFSIRTNNLEKKYIHEGDKQIIIEKYKDYNQSYKIRNVLLISYATVWLFSQLDLFFLNPEQISFELNNSDITTSNQLNPLEIKLSLNFSF